MVSHKKKRRLTAYFSHGTTRNLTSNKLRLRCMQSSSSLSPYKMIAVIVRYDTSQLSLAETGPSTSGTRKGDLPTRETTTILKFFLTLFRLVLFLRPFPGSEVRAKF